MAASCYRYPRIARGIAGAIVGGIVGHIFVSAIGLDEGISEAGVPKRGSFVAVSVPLVFAASGAAAAAWKKEC
jgi:hypothetical protein